jgi:hypothetical protein
MEWPHMPHTKYAFSLYNTYLGFTCLRETIWFDTFIVIRSIKRGLIFGKQCWMRNFYGILRLNKKEKSGLCYSLRITFVDCCWTRRRRRGWYWCCVSYRINKWKKWTVKFTEIQYRIGKKENTRSNINVTNWLRRKIYEIISWRPIDQMPCSRSCVD